MLLRVGGPPRGREVVENGETVRVFGPWREANREWRTKFIAYDFVDHPSHDEQSNAVSACQNSSHCLCLYGLVKAIGTSKLTPVKLDN